MRHRGGTHEDFDAIGALQHQLLVFAGLERADVVVEIGCGAGRLAVKLRDWLEGPYLGTDVVEELLDHARTMCARPDWRFVCVDGLEIPADSGSANIVCAFSVFTHLLHEASYSYMREAARVLRSGGSLVFSFLEFRVPSHWDVMQANLEHLEAPGILNQFMSVDAVQAWSEHLGLEVAGIFRGDEPYIPLDRPVVLQGHEFEAHGTFGQSAAILRKP